jgi:lipopolysaccharide export system protein LptC
LSRLVFITLLSIASLAIAFVLNFQMQSELSSDSDSVVDVTEPDFYMTQTSGIKYDLSGNPHYRFLATDLKKYPQGEFTLMSNPDVTLHNSKGPWRAQALTGEISQDGKTITLSGSVRLNGGTRQEPLQMKTQTLSIIPDQNLAKTSKQVFIENNSGQTNAIGMNAYLDENRMELLSNVQVRHRPVKTN